ncbi:MAG TPA: SMC-Scp complex subunit ScpB [Gammaproteobacteria bacterium]|jgi:segregation and condensation protein B|nr:SMC-Scp complex subunit ScpB [Gammaproteobacteria bacterium]
MKPEKKTELRNIIEGALLAAGRPLSLDELLALFPDDSRPDRGEMRKALDVLKAEFEGRGIELKEVASGYRIQVRQELAPWIGRLWEERPARYSRALLETLALVAYRQPITRGEIEEVRGVTVSTHIIRTLQERGWVRIVGHRDVPGHPEMFGTTKEFLDYFSLKSLDELPTLAQLRDIESINAELDFGTDADGIPAQAAAPAAAPRLAEDESAALDEGESGITTH